MKNAIAIAAVAGLAAAASAQSVKLTFSATASEINVGDTVSWTVSATFTGFADPSAYFGGFNGDFLASDNTLGTAGNFVNNMGFQGFPATANGADVNLNVFNSALLGTDDQSLGIFFEFDVTAEAVGALSYTESGITSMFADDDIFTQPTEFLDVPTNSDIVSIVPAPGAVALLGLGGLVAGRRRR